MKRLNIILFLLALAVLTVEAKDLKVADIFGDNMVLQQKTVTPIWGWADAGTTVTVTSSWNDKSYSTKAGRDGTWRIMLHTPEAGGPYVLTITGDNTLIFSDIYVGEVWLASGQSNMAMQLKECYESTKAILTSQKSNIRFINVPPLGSYKPLTDIKADWVVAAPENVGDCSAVAWYFAHFIQENLGVPVGIINASFGGSVVETWMSRETCQTLGDISVPEVSDGTTGWEANIPTTMYNGMLNPIVGYGIQGCIWYQGESNAGEAFQYRDLMPLMITDWRNRWGYDFPFYMVQLASFTAKQTAPVESTWAELREAQTRTLHLQNTGMAVAIDIGEEFDIHPKNKQEVGRRLALAARAQTYGEKIPYSGPIYKSYKIEGNKIRIFFDHIDGGLKTANGEMPKGFTIAGVDHKFHWADAVIEGNTVVVSSSEVTLPVAVRYAWADYPICNMYNGADLPMSPFRTDDWKGITYVNK